MIMSRGEEQIQEILAKYRTGEHYGPYGTACINTGQFDAGECWKCQNSRLRTERAKLRDELEASRRNADGLEALVVEFQKDYCPAGCIFGLGKSGKLYLVGDCRAPSSQHCKASIRDRGAY